MKFKLSSIFVLVGVLLTVSSVVFAANNDSTLIKMKDVCVDYAKHRLILDQKTYTKTRDSDYNLLEKRLFALGAEKVDEYANCSTLNVFPARDEYIGNVFFKNVKRCVRVKFIYKNQLHESGYCK